MRAPVVEIGDIFGQDPLLMAFIKLTWSRHSLLTDLTQRSAIALARGDLNGVQTWGNTNIAHPTIECGTITAVAVMNEKSWRLAIPGTAFDNLLSRPRGGGIRRHVHVENLPAGVIDHEEHVKRSECDRSDAEEVARPDLRAVLPQE